jgi:peptidoglycan/LPS O-acetylase OafA/YrhL
MTPERAAELVTGWVRFYTRRLPAVVAERRIDEIDADLYDHIAHERAGGTDDRRIALSVLSRMVRGLAADTAWRNRIRPWKGDLMKSVAANLAVALALVAVGVAAMVYGGNDDAPGLVLIGLLLVVAAVVIGARAVYRRRRSADRP